MYPACPALAGSFRQSLSSLAGDRRNLSYVSVAPCFIGHLKNKSLNYLKVNPNP
jgi:hypothetical protein